MSKKILIIFSLILFSAFLLSNFCFAQTPLEIEYPEIAGEKPETTAIGLPTYVKYIFNFSLGIAGLIAFLSLILGGFCYLTSTGKPNKQKGCKDQILAGILGLIILLSSYLILTTINPQLVVFHLPPLETIVIPTPEPTMPTEEERVFTYFQIPTGKIIERPFNVVIPNVEYYDYDNNCNLIQYVPSKDLPLIEAANKLSLELKCKSKKLNKLLFATLKADGISGLKELTDLCHCGIASCKNRICPPSHICPGFHCCIGMCTPAQKNAIMAKANEIQVVINEIKALKTKPVNIAFVRDELAFNLLQLEKASLLMSAPFEVKDYNTMLKIRQELKKYDIEIEFYPSEINPDSAFPDWEDILIGTGSADPASFYFFKDQGEILVDQARNLTVTSGEYEGPSIPPSPPVALIDIDNYCQTNPSWADKCIIKKCKDAGSCILNKCTETSNPDDVCSDGYEDLFIKDYGSGVASLAAIISYLGEIVNPSDIVDKIDEKDEGDIYLYYYPCELDTILLFIGARKLAVEDYGVSSKKIYLYEINEEIGKDHPVLAQCSKFNYGNPRSSIVKGIKNGRVYFQDPSNCGQISFTIEDVEQFECGFYSFYK
ncbi:hypothetical protein AMJ49_04785 [Parcubacteria bacterium DG_74_2]|nr:MAG: hypothetical protein AMJ49_04785 [Parcubacteria bacterium DG_74_2]